MPPESATLKPQRNLSTCQATPARFSRWAKNGMWQSVFEHLAADADNEYAMIDSTIVRAHQHSAGAPKKDDDHAIGRSKGGLARSNGTPRIYA